MASSSYLSGDDILTAVDLAAEDVPVEAWGGTVRVRGLTGTERDRFEFALAAAADHPDRVEVRSAIVGRCLVDGDGKRLFTDAQLPQLGGKSGAALDQLFDVVRRLSGMSDDAAEDAAQDFGSAPDGGSPSGSPAT